MHPIVTFAFLAMWLPSYAQDRQPGRGEHEILVPGKHWDLLGQGYHLTGDSTVDKDGNVFFTDESKNRILKIDLEGKISTWKEGSNGAHGIAFGPDGRLYAGQHDLKRLVAFSSDGKESVIAEDVQSHHLTVTARNHVYLTVPPAHKVWLIEPSGNKRVVIEGINWPRAVRASADQSRLVVNDPPTQWVWSYKIETDGSLTGGQKIYRLEAPSGSSKVDAGGMAFDTEDFLYVATDLGVQVFDPSGRGVAIVKPPGKEDVSSVFFAGPNLKWMYVTDGNRMYRHPVKRAGAPSWNPVKLVRSPL